jgi:hypothetical protein
MTKKDKTWINPIALFNVFLQASFTKDLRLHVGTSSICSLSILRLFEVQNCLLWHKIVFRTSFEMRLARPLNVFQFDKIIRFFMVWIPHDFDCLIKKTKINQSYCHVQRLSSGIFYKGLQCTYWDFYLLTFISEAFWGAKLSFVAQNCLSYFLWNAIDRGVKCFTILQNDLIPMVWILLPLVIRQKDKK